MRRIEYVPALGSDGRRRTCHERIEGKVVCFTVQYEISVQGQWYPVVRYDTAHGSAQGEVVVSIEKKRI